MSQNLQERIPMPPGLTARTLEAVPLRGKETDVGLVAIVEETTSSTSLRPRHPRRPLPTPYSAIGSLWDQSS